ncbi:MAG: hypothetical protein ABI600_20660 [Luteolibacter sp.]
MKTTKLITLAALLGTCAFAAAQDEAKRPERPKREIPPELLKQFDTDHDGKLSDAERTAMQEAMKAKAEERKAKMLEKYDSDHDGKLSDAEREVMHTDMEAKHKAILEKYDANKNGKLDPEEVAAARAAGEELPPMMGRGGPRGPDGPGGKRGKGGPKGPGGPGGPGAPPDGGTPPPPAE